MTGPLTQIYSLIVLDMGFFMVGTQSRRVIPPLLLVLNFPERCEILDNRLHWITRNVLLSTMKMVGCMAHFGRWGRQGGGNTAPNKREMNVCLTGHLEMTTDSLLLLCNDLSEEGEE